jgi:hypothetical protein
MPLFALMFGGLPLDFFRPYIVALVSKRNEVILQYIYKCPLHIINTCEVDQLHDWTKKITMFSPSGVQPFY